MSKPSIPCLLLSVTFLSICFFSVLYAPAVSCICSFPCFPCVPCILSVHFYPWCPSPVSLGSYCLLLSSICFFSVLCALAASCVCSFPCFPCVPCILSLSCTLGVPAQYALPPTVCYVPLCVVSVLYAPAVSCVCSFHIAPCVPYVLCVPCVPLGSAESLVFLHGTTGIVPSISSSPIHTPPPHPSSFSIQCCLANDCNNQSVAPRLSLTVAPSASTTLTIKLILTLHQNSCLCILCPECVFVKAVGLEGKRLHTPFLALSRAGKTKALTASQ